MPLTLTLYNQTEAIGHLIIDRNNLIFALPCNMKNSMEISELAQKRDYIGSVIRQSDSYRRLTLNNQNLFGMFDPRHSVRDHLSSYDNKKAVHYHLRFKNDVTITDLQLVFKDIFEDQSAKINDVISPKCRQEILTIAKNYFDELVTSEQAQAIEQYYRQEKDQEFQKIDLKVNVNRL